MMEIAEHMGMVATELASGKIWVVCG